MFDLRTSDNKQTLLEFLVKIVEQKFPELSDFYQGLKAVSKAHGSMIFLSYLVFGLTSKMLSVQLSILKEEMFNFKSYLDSMKLQLPKIKADEDYLFLASLEPFLDDLTKAYAELTQEFDNFSSAFESSCHAFGEDANKVQLEEFLEPIDAFIKNFERIQQDYRRRLEREEQSQRRKEVTFLYCSYDRILNLYGKQAREKQSMMTKIKKQEKVPSASQPVAPKSSGRLDDLLNSLKSGSFKIEESASINTNSKELPSRKTSNPSKGSTATLGGSSSKALDFFESFAFSTSFDSTLSTELGDFCL